MGCAKKWSARPLDVRARNPRNRVRWIANHFNMIAKYKLKGVKKERPRIMLVIRSIVVDHGKVLVIRRTPNERWNADLWEFPGGKLEDKQDVSHALETEVLEETGLFASTTSRLAYIETKMTTRGPYVGLPYIEIVGLSKVVGGNVKLSSQHQSYRWVTPKQALKMKLTEEARKALIALQTKI